MLGKPKNWSTIFSKLSIEKFAAASWPEIKTKIADTAPAIFEEFIKLSPLTANDLKHKYDISKGLAIYAINKELKNLDEETRDSYKKSMESLAIIMSPVFSEMVENAIRQEMVKELEESQRVTAQTKKLPTNPQDLMDITKFAKELKTIKSSIRRLEMERDNDDNGSIDEEIEKLSKQANALKTQIAKAKIFNKMSSRNTGRGAVEDEGRWMENVLQEVGADPAEKLEEKETEKAEQDLVPIEMAPSEQIEENLENADLEDSEGIRIELLKKLIELSKNPSPEAQEQMKGINEELNNLYAKINSQFNRKADKAGDAPAEGMPLNIPWIAEQAYKGFLRDESALEHFKNVAIRSLVLLAKKGTVSAKDVTAELLYTNESLFRDTVDFEVKKSLPQSIPGQSREEYFAEIKKHIMGFADKVIHEPSYAGSLSEYEEAIPGEDRKYAKEAFRETVSNLDKIYRRWRTANPETLVAFRQDATKAAIEYVTATNPSPEEIKRMHDERRPNDAMVSQWVDEVLAASLEQSDGSMIKSINDELGFFVETSSYTPEEMEKLKNALAVYVKNDLEGIWNRAYGDVLKAAGKGPSKGQSDVEMKETVFPKENADVARNPEEMAFKETVNTREKMKDFINSNFEPGTMDELLSLLKGNSAPLLSKDRVRSSLIIAEWKKESPKSRTKVQPNTSIEEFLKSKNVNGIPEVQMSWILEQLEHLRSDFSAKAPQHTKEKETGEFDMSEG